MLLPCRIDFVIVWSFLNLHFVRFDMYVSSFNESELIDWASLMCFGSSFQLLL